MSRPPGDHRSPNAALVQILFVAAERAVAVETFVHGAYGTVVAGEKNDGTVVESKFFQQRHHSAHITVQAGNHGGVVLLGLGPIFVGIGGIGRHLELAVRDGVGQIQKKGSGRVRLGRVRLGGIRFFLTLADVFQGGFGEHVMTVSNTLPILVFIERVLLFIYPQIRSVVVVGFALVEVSQGIIEALPIGTAHRTGATQAPLTQQSGAVAFSLQEFGHGHGRVGNGQIPFGFVIVVAPDVGVAGVQARHQRSAGRGANSTSRVELRELHAFFGQPVDVGRVD